MSKLSINDITKYVSEHIEEFHKSKLKALEKLKLKTVLKKKNPYLFKAKNILTAQDLVKTLMDAFLSSQEETIFGDFLEDLAIFICSKEYKGRKSSTTGIDLEFERKGIRYIVAIKSGPNWGNSSQVKKMKSDFITAKKVLSTSRSKIIVVAVNGCCYGRNKKPNKGDYYKYCGQEFWEFISSNPNLYLQIIEPLGYEARKHNDSFIHSYSSLINIFTQQFMEQFCENGRIDWEKLVKFNSSKSP